MAPTSAPTPHGRTRRPGLGRRCLLGAAMVLVTALAVAVNAGALHPFGATDTTRTAAVLTSAKSATNVFTAATLTAPTGLTGTRSGGANNLTWTTSPHTGVTGYRIDSAPASTGPWSTAGSTSGRTASTFADTNASQFSATFYRVTAHASNWTSPTSAVFSLTPPPEVLSAASDMFASAGNAGVILSGQTITLTGNNTGSTAESGEPTYGGRGSGTLWVKVRPAVSGTLNASICRSYTGDPTLGIYTSKWVSATGIIDDRCGGNGLGSIAEQRVIADTWYYIQIGMYNTGTGGNYTLDITLKP